MSIIKSKTAIKCKTIFGNLFDTINFILFGTTFDKDNISLGNDDYLIW